MKIGVSECQTFPRNGGMFSALSKLWYNTRRINKQTADEKGLCTMGAKAIVQASARSNRRRSRVFNMIQSVLFQKGILHIRHILSENFRII